MKGFEDIIITDDSEVQEETECVKPSCKKPEKGGKTVHVAFVMDHSGSMSFQQKLALDNYNEQLASLKRKSNESGIETYVTLVEFDNRIIVKYEDRLIDEIKPETDYWTEGLTSLNDAIFKGTSLLKKSMKNDTCEDKSALIIIMTDGHENSSKEFAGDKGANFLKKEIEKLEKTDEWTFTFMGAGIDVQATAVAGLGMGRGNTISFSADSAVFKMSGGSVKNGIGTYYSARMGGAKTVSDFHVNNTTTAADVQTTSNTVKEEEEKE